MAQIQIHRGEEQKTDYRHGGQCAPAPVAGSMADATPFAELHPAEALARYIRAFNAPGHQRPTMVISALLEQLDRLPPAMLSGEVATLHLQLVALDKVQLLVWTAEILKVLPAVEKLADSVKNTSS